MSLIRVRRRTHFVELEFDVSNGVATPTELGGDLTHEYVSENADYRS